MHIELHETYADIFINNVWLMSFPIHRDDTSTNIQTRINQYLNRSTT